MTLSDLLNKRLILLSGKGGVGKTTVALLLALMAARQKKKVLIVEMTSTERVAPYFGLKSIGHREIPLSPYITGINLDPQECFEEYVLMQIRFKTLFDAFFNNRFVTYFLNAIPGLNDLLMIGKIYHLEKQIKDKRTGERLYDLIIVDGPATGHGMSTFEVPGIVKEAVKVGPLKTQSENILNLITDPEKTAFSVVTLAEEMPVVEATELIRSVREKLHISLGPVFVNAFHERFFDAHESGILEKKMPERDSPLYPYFAYALLDDKRARLNHTYRSLLKEKNGDLDCLTIPYQYGELTGIKDLERVADELI